MEELLCKFKEKIISKIEDKLKERNLKIQELSPKFTRKKNAFKKLEIISNDNEQCRRRSCSRIHGIEFKEGHNGDVMEELEKIYNVMRIPFNEIDRAHGIGKPFLDKERKKKVIKLRFFKARPQNYVNGREKPGLTSFSVSLDLAVTRYQQRSRVLSNIILL